jgi:hypothetical protein
MATVVFTMASGTIHTVPDVTLTQVSQAWWRWAQGAGDAALPVAVFPEEEDIRNLRGITTYATQAEVDANPHVHIGDWVRID